MARTLLKTILAPQIAYLSEQQPSGTAGGTSIATTWTTRTLNTLVDTTAIVTSLTSNQFTLSAGTYRISAVSTFYTANNVKIRIRNITDNTTAIVGQTVVGSTSTYPLASLDGEIVISSSKTFALQYYVQAGTATLGLGQPVSSGEMEIYSQLAITKIK